MSNIGLGIQGSTLITNNNLSTQYVNVTSVAVASTYVFGCTILGIYI
jgi:hypothetical protein